MQMIKYFYKKYNINYKNFSDRKITKEKRSAKSRPVCLFYIFGSYVNLDDFADFRVESYSDVVSSYVSDRAS